MYKMHFMVLFAQPGLIRGGREIMDSRYEGMEAAAEGGHGRTQPGTAGHSRDTGVTQPDTAGHSGHGRTRAGHGET